MSDQPREQLSQAVPFASSDHAICTGYDFTQMPDDCLASDNRQINLAPNTAITLDSLSGSDFRIRCGGDVTVKTDDFILEQDERSQQQDTEQRRSLRSQRRRLTALAGLACVLLLLVVAPSMVSHSSIGRSYLIDYLNTQGLQADVASVRIGWLTPLRITDLKINGKSGSQIAIEQFDLNLMVGDLISLPDDLGQINLRGVAVACAMNNGKCSLEDDFETFFHTDSQQSATLADVQLHDVTILITDSDTAQRWTLTQSNASLSIATQSTELSLAGVLSEPGGDHGSLQSKIKLTETPGGTTENQWSLDLSCESLPISITELLLTRFPEMTAGIPTQIHGDATGTITAAGNSDGSVTTNLENFEIRNLTASRAGTHIWTNEHAVVDGKLAVDGERLIGEGLSAHTDFASATIDGAFSRSFSLTGSKDNPLQWLETIDGNASAEIDIAALARALPGLLPLRSGVTLESGRAIAHLASIPNGSQQQKKLHIDCNAFRALSQGREFTIDPITLIATVSSNHGQLMAEQFEWRSAFGTAIGSGNLESGSADFKIDFGQLTNMLLPIFDMTETLFAGNAHGKIQWTSNDQDIWRLTGNGQTTNLLIQLPDGRKIQRNAMKAAIAAEGRWHNNELRALTQTNLILNSLGLDLNATLAEPVNQLSQNSKLPFNLRAEGRLDILEDILDPWLPQSINQFAGNFSTEAKAFVGLHETIVTSGAMELNGSSFSYNQRRFQQPLVKIQFDGKYNWPANALTARSITIAGDAFSFAGQGTVSTDQIDMELKYRANLDRMQGSLGSENAANQPIQTVTFQANAVPQTDVWMVLGDCEGDISLRSIKNDLIIKSSSIGQNIACLQPAAQHASMQTVGPWRQQDGQRPPEATVVWSEPNLTLDFHLRYQPDLNSITAEQVQIAGDWFAANLSGEALWTSRSSELHLTGSSRLKMNEVAQRFSKVADTDIRATGIHEADLSFQAGIDEDNNLEFALATDLGWETVEIAGMDIGQASVPVILTETSLKVEQAQVPINRGVLAFAGQLHYRPGPVWMHLEPGASATAIQLTPEMTEQWLKYIAPLVADATRIQGTLGAQIDEATVVFDQPQQSQILGRINISKAEMAAGPLASQIIQGIAGLTSLTNGLGPLVGPHTAQQPNFSSKATNLVTLPAQTVDFSVRRGIVSHQRLYLQLDRAQVITSGRVAFDGSLNMIAQIPLDPRWLGRDLQQLAGQVVTLPIDGSITRPSLDSSSFRQIATQLGAEAVQSTAENYLQQQLNKGLDKIFRW